MSAGRGAAARAGRADPDLPHGPCPRDGLAAPLLRRRGQLQLLPGSGLAGWRRLADHPRARGLAARHDRPALLAASAAGLPPPAALAADGGHAPAGPGAGRLRQRRARGRSIARARSPGLGRAGARQHWPAEDVREAWVDGPARWIVRGFFGLVACVRVLRALRWLWLRRRNIRLTYPGGREISVARGLTILEASRLMGIPHASVCGGRGRCSTCRVRIGQGRGAAAATVAGGAPRSDPHRGCTRRAAGVPGAASGRSRRDAV